MRNNTMQTRHEGIGAGELDHEAISEGASQAGIGILIALAALVGIWGVSCLVGGITAGSGLTELVRGWLAAVSGI